MSNSKEADIQKLGKSLRQEIIENKDEPDIERVSDLLEALSKHKAMPVSVLQKTRIGNTLTKCIKTLNRHKRTSSQKETLTKLIDKGESLLGQWKKAADKETNEVKKQKKEVEDKAEGLPQTVSEYNTRLNKQKKEMYKNPPVLPPDHVTIEEGNCPSPKRDKKTGMLSFVCGEDKSIQKLLQDFHPNRSPEDIMRAGAFGGTYYRPIASAVTNIHYNANDVLRDSVDPKWIEGLDKKLMLTSSKYSTAVNKFGVKCGGSLGMWESSGWISDADP